MFTATAVGPTLEELRPFKATRGPEFPVHPDLGQRLLDHDPGSTGDADAVVAHALAVCSAYSYASVVELGRVPNTLARMMARIGLPSNRVLMVADRIDAAFIVASGFLVQSDDGSSAILAYRGTEPFNVANWMTDADLHNSPVTIEVGGTEHGVHPGFYRNLRAIRSPLMEGLGQALAGRSIIDGSPLPHRLESLHLTGHSLGAAMAALTGVLLLEDPDYSELGALLRSCYGFGAPMAGSAGLADAMAASGHDQRFLRFRYRNDVVTGLPPRGLGDYAHFGPEYAVAPGGGYRRMDRTQRQSSFFAIPIAPLQFIAHRLPLLRCLPFPYSLDDHLPLNYVDWLAPAESVSEFGDYPARFAPG